MNVFIWSKSKFHEWNHHNISSQKPAHTFHKWTTNSLTPNPAQGDAIFILQKLLILCLKAPSDHDPNLQMVDQLCQMNACGNLACYCGHNCNTAPTNGWVSDNFGTIGYLISMLYSMSTLLLIKSLEQGPEERNRTSYFFCILPFIGIVGGTRCFYF